MIHLHRQYDSCHGAPRFGFACHCLACDDAARFGAARDGFKYGALVRRSLVDAGAAS